MTGAVAAALVLLAVARAAPPGEPPARSGPFQRGDLVVTEDELVRSRADAAAAELRFRGVVRIEHDGKLLVEKGYGGSEPGTAFWVASVSKSFTAVLVLRLRELGKLRLEDPIARFLPGAPAAARGITVDDLLKHTSGLPRATYEAEGVADAREAVRRILALPRGERGRFAYTNDGYALLAIVAEKAGGAPFQELLRREVLERAGLAHTGFWPGCVPGLPVAKLSRAPAGPRAKESWGSKGSEGICTTAADLARFIGAVADGTLVSPASRDLLWADAVPIASGFAARGFFTSVGARGERVVWTRGTEDAGHNAVAKWLPDSRVLVVVLSDVPEPKADVPAPSRAMADLLEERLPRLP